MASFNAFCVRGIRVRVDQSWFIAFLLFAWTLSVGYFPFQVPNYSPFTYWFFGTLSSLGLFGCVLLHELSHCIVAQRLGIPVRQITLSLVEEAEHIRLIVADTGPGVAPAIADHLFTPFNTNRQAGLGLGLVIAQDIMTELGGWLRHLPSTTGATFDIGMRRA